MSRRYVKRAMEEEARLTYSARSVVDQLLHPDSPNPAEEPLPPQGRQSILPLKTLPAADLIPISAEMVLWAGMFQMFAGMVNAMLQAQPGAAQFPAHQSVVSGSPVLLPFQNSLSREG
jgi:hypothetical protein